MKVKKENSKGEFQHRMFKLIILIIVFIFCGLIIGFIYITITSSKSQKAFKIMDQNFITEESILKSNEKYQKIIESIDNNYFMQSNNSNDLLICDSHNFYKMHITRHIPCIYNLTNKDDIPAINSIKNKKDISYFNVNDIGVIDFIDKYMKLLSIEVYNKNNNNDEYFKIPKLDNIGRVIINNSIKKIHIYLSPVSQIVNFNSYQKKSSSEFINIYLKNNIDDKLQDNFGEKKIIYYEFILNEGDFIYAPSYYFIQIKEPVDNLFIYEYQDISLFNDIVFKILYNENSL